MTDADPLDDRNAAAVPDEDAAARAVLYDLLARLFDEPDAAVHRALASGDLEAQFEALLSGTSLSVVAAGDLRTDDDLDLLKARFNDLFAVGYPEPPVSPYESDHREAGWHDVNLDLARAYDFFGVRIADGRREHHDHLRLELEFAGYLARREAVGDDDGPGRARLGFLDRHLRHLVRGVRDGVDDEPNTGPYGPLAERLVAFVAADRDDLAARFDGTCPEEARP